MATIGLRLPANTPSKRAPSTTRPPLHGGGHAASRSQINERSVPAAPEAVRLADAFAKIEAAAPLRELPAVVLSADKPRQPPSASATSAAATGVTFADGQASQKLLALGFEDAAPEVVRSIARIIQNTMFSCARYGSPRGSQVT